MNRSIYTGPDRFKAKNSTTMYSPAEILSAILCYRPKIDLKKARLVCKAFDAAAIASFFDGIFVTARYVDVEKAILLASRFGPFIKTLIFCSEEFEQGGVSWETFCHGKENKDLATTYYITYCNRTEESEDLLKEGELFGHLSSSLIVPINLQKVILTNVCREQGLCLCHQAYVGGCLQTFIPFRDEDHPPLKSPRPAPNHECFTSTNGLEKVNSNDYPRFLRALFTSGNTKVESNVTGGGDSTLGPVTSAFCMTPRQNLCGAKVLPNLTNLHLHHNVEITKVP
ncbi:hypothetical protein HO173_005561 [Letharia columbiana]|uniref:F-box domain-containing protein n=1 Tax=Letharia columbiana TaxID=112416 RepID=A0A8H6FWV8_9LECA|nr:uncharacterized protein HO173_005561 [Letharia columbiana]KAF6236308.1 hypothetical protein HO173_005561 [Letharia columbiana]